MSGRTKSWSIALAMSLFLVVFAGGCAQGDDSRSDQEGGLTQEVPSASYPSDSDKSEGGPLPSDADPSELDGETESQQDGSSVDILRLNSLAMTNHIAVLTERIAVSEGGRAVLEETYSSLLNNIYPGAVDGRTLEQIEKMLDVLEGYRMISEKREALSYLYEQHRAYAISQIQSNHLSLFGITQSKTILGAAASAVGMAVGTVSSYGTAMEMASVETLFDEWDLRDAEHGILHELRKGLFSYTVEMVGEYDLPGNLALSEDAVAKFASWLENDNTVRRVQFLEDGEDVYGAYGGYWIALAQGYYELGMFEECLSAVSAYESLEIGIFRRDVEYASVIPMALMAAAEILSDAEYVVFAEDRLLALLENCESDDWASRHFAALAYMDLASQTDDEKYLALAYDIALNNVNELVDMQLKMNEEYLNELSEVEITDSMTKEQRESVKDYNDMRKNARKTELPPVYMPLAVSCDLLFSLIDSLGVAEGERAKIDEILHPLGESIFITAPLDDEFRFKDSSNEGGSVSIEAGGAKLKVSAGLTSEFVEIELLVNGNLVGGSWTTKKVQRGEEGVLETFVVEFENEEARGCFSDGDEVVVRIKNLSSVTECHFDVFVDERFWILPDSMEFKSAA